MKVFAFLLVIGLVSAFTEVEYKDAFVEWMHNFGKVYAADEFQKRFEAFRNNMDFVAEWNGAGHSHTVELNFLADLSNEEYQQIYLGTQFDTETTVRVEMDVHSMSGQVLNDTVDWRLKGAVTAVKNQAQCGSCWAFSTTGSIEGAHQLASGTLVSLSEQNLMDCSTAYGNHACNGGLMDNAFKYVIANHGIDTEASYPYTMKAQSCAFSAANVGATISSYKDIPTNNEQALADAIQSVGPISVAIDAAHSSFQLYKAGVYYEKACSATRLDHGVLAVGFGTDATGQDYYIVKNSWGATWGMQGFINMSRNKQNNCGIATMSSYPIV